ncbi:MAG: inositol phosphate phosphatase SopB [bacterium]
MSTPVNSNQSIFSGFLQATGELVSTIKGSVNTGIGNVAKLFPKNLSPVLSLKSRIVSLSESCATSIKNFVQEGIGKINQQLPHKETKLERGFRFLKKIPKEIKTKFQIGGITCEGTYSPITFQGCWFNNCLKSMFHLSNPWFFHIKSGESESHFLRTASTRGNEQATKELAICALASQCGGFVELPELSEQSPLELNLSNIQLMTPGKFSDGDIPLKQMQALQKLAEQQHPVEIERDGKTFYVKVNQPLLFNFGVNAQHFRLGRLARSKEIDEINQKSFALLFGDDPRNIGPRCFCKEGSVIEKFLNDCKDKTKKQQVQQLAEQIIYILKNYPNGIESNPYALPARVSVLTELLGRAVSFNCKSGKDRTSLLAMEIKLLEAELNSNTGKKIVLPLPDETTDEERKILHQLYLDEANGVVYANIGKQTLDIKEILGFNSLRERFGANLRKVLLVNALEELNKRVVEKLENLGNAKSPSDPNIRIFMEIGAQATILLEKAKKKPKDLTEEDRKAMQDASGQLKKILDENKNNKALEEYRDLIVSITDSSERFFSESPEGSSPKKVTPQTEESPKEQLRDESSPESPKSSQPKGSLKPSQFLVTQKMLQSVKLKPLDRA